MSKSFGKIGGFGESPDELSLIDMLQTQTRIVDSWSSSMRKNLLAKVKESRLKDEVQMDRIRVCSRFAHQKNFSSTELN